MLFKQLHLLALGILSSSSLFVTTKAISPENNYQPEQLVSQDGKLDVTLNVDLVSSLDGKRLAPGYNGNPIGPTLRVKPGDTLTVTLNNNLDPSPAYDRELMEYVQNPNSDESNVTIIYNRLTANGNIYDSDYGYWGLNYMNLHFHGAMFDPLLENTFEVLDGGESKTYKFDIPNDQPPGLHWYHNHVHGTGQSSTMSGLHGVLVIEGTEDDLTAVPEIEKATEVFMMLGEADLNPETKMPNPFVPIVMKFDWLHTTNGHDGADTTLTFSKGETVFFRMTSVSIEPALYLSIDEHILYPVAHDGYVIPTPLSSGEETVTMDAGSRLEFMTTFDKPGTYTFRRGPWNLGISGPGCAEVFGIDLETCVSFDVERVVATIIVTDNEIIPVEASKKAFPQELPSYHSYLDEMASQESVRTRTITMDQAEEYPFFQLPYDESLPMKGVPTALGMNGRYGNPFHVEDPKIEKGSCETWQISSHAPIGHSFHVHSTPYLVTNVDGVDVETPYWRDTMGVNFNMTVHICFPRHTGYLLVHCHMPAHQDIGMLTYYEVVEPTGTDTAPSFSPSASPSASPTPASSGDMLSAGPNTFVGVTMVSLLVMLYFGGVW
mmetsp:Transcript_24682/g.38025  ORF Transcript_24682/g.38025 Transcript_24682/m.38025 type:complete len:605 (-) Transcript_24682:603-2417(-)